MRVQEFHDKAFSNQAFIIHFMHQVVVPESRPALVHDLSLSLRVEVLSNLAHDTDDLSLPSFQQGCILFNEVKQVLFRIFREANRFFSPVHSRGQGWFSRGHSGYAECTPPAPVSELFPAPQTSGLVEHSD